ncbi:hypothetical protein [Streptomyces sp. NPDC089919]|uniref:hypothetical protein n=1 Tax=Streptomyces sp. NPDC089919 TaxID=3155188 RepID=UPI00343F890E
MRWMNKGAVRAVQGALLLLLVVAAGSLLMTHTAGRARPGPGCRSVAYMSVTGLGPECR